MADWQKIATDETYKTEYEPFLKQMLEETHEFLHSENDPIELHRLQGQARVLSLLIAAPDEAVALARAQEKRAQEKVDEEKENGRRRDRGWGFIRIRERQREPVG